MNTLYRHRGGFSLVEILVTIGLSSIFFTAAALIFQNITANRKSLGTIETVQLGATTSASNAVIQNFYGLDQNTIQVYSAPNYGRAGMAANLYENFLDDIAQSSAVYCLGRNGINTLRPTTIAYAGGSAPLDTPEAFRQHLLTVDATAAAAFVAYDTISTAEDATVFMVEPGSSATELGVVAVYDIDVVTVTQGNYVSVRRYEDGLMTAYYDVVYPTGTGTAFSPMIAHFKRKGLAATEADADLAKYMIAEEQPFYLMWLPDPSTRTLESPTDPPNPTAPLTDAIWDYYRMGGRTQFMLTIPAFPSLL